MTIKKTKSPTIVITGLSGKFPQSDNPEQLWENLVNGNILYQPDEFNYPKSKLIKTKPKEKIKGQSDSN